jgi:flavin reductase (NADH)
MTAPRRPIPAVLSILGWTQLRAGSKGRVVRRRTEIPMRGQAADWQVFRQVMGVFPSPVSVVTAMDAGGLPRGLTCSAMCSLSMTPPSLLICVNRRNRSLEAIRHSDGFVVNLLRAGRHEVSDVFASASPTKFAGTRWQPGPTLGLPYLAGDALAFVECDLQAEIRAGSHAILIGLVRGSGIDAPDDGPLVYWRRSYGRWTADIPSTGTDGLVATDGRAP